MLSNVDISVQQRGFTATYTSVQSPSAASSSLSLSSLKTVTGCMLTVIQLNIHIIDISQLRVMAVQR